MKLSIIVPCYNEEKGIPNLAEQLNPVVKELKRKYTVELVFVDDGSTDKTNELLHKYWGTNKNAAILTHKKNKNLGAALKTAFAYASGDYVTALDSDCTYHPRLIVTMLDMMNDTTDIVTVSPYHPKGKVVNVEPYRIFLSKSASRIYKFLLHSNIYTISAMVRVYRKEVIKIIKFKSNTFLGVTEIMVRAILHGYHVTELPAELHVRKYGSSKMKTVSVIMEHLKLMTAIILHQLFGIKI